MINHTINQTINQIVSKSNLIKFLSFIVLTRLNIKRRRQFVNFILWAFSIFLSLFSIFMPYFWNDTHPSTTESVLYAAFHRPIFSAGLALLTFLLINGNASECIFNTPSVLHCIRYTQYLFNRSLTPSISISQESYDKMFN